MATPIGRSSQGLIGKWVVLTNVRYRVRISLEKFIISHPMGLIQWKHLTQLGQENQTQKTIGLNTVGRKTRPRDHIWAKTIYGQTERPYMGFNTVGQENQTQKTIEFNTVGRKTRPRDHIWAKTIYGQRPYMGKDHTWDSTQWDRKIRPKRR